ncbi:MAG: DUF1232 domain-containing protein [Dehalococcoidia bacterium]
MDLAWWETALIVVLGTIAALLLAALIVWWLASKRTKAIAGRVKELPWRHKLMLARRLLQDERIPLLVRALLPAIVVYLALPIDLVPDFIPVIGQIDDVLVLVVGMALLVRMTPARVLDEHLAEVEREAIDATAVEAERPARPTLPPGS